MPKPYTVVVAEYANYPKAQIGLQVLRMRGFVEDRVSVVTRNDPELVELERARREQLQQSGPSETGTAGAAIAAGMAAPMAIGTMVMPFFLIGPLAAAATGAAVGTLFGDAKKLNMEDSLASSYQQRVSDGAVLVIVHATPDELVEAYGGLKTTDTLSLERF